MLLTITIMILAVVGIVLVLSWLTLWQIKVGVQENWICVQNSLRSRFEASGELADFLRPHLSNEVKTFRRLTDTREAVEHPGFMNVRSRAVAEEELRLATLALLTVAGSYPELLSDREFITRYRKFYGADDLVGALSRRYNAAVASYNATITRHRHWLVAKWMRLRPREIFAAPSPTN